MNKQTYKYYGRCEAKRKNVGLWGKQLFKKNQDIFRYNMWCSTMSQRKKQKQKQNKQT